MQDRLSHGTTLQGNKNKTQMKYHAVAIMENGGAMEKYWFKRIIISPLLNRQFECGA